MKDYLIYELAPYPISHFHEGMMKKTQKSKLYNYFKPINKTINLEECCTVLDGGFLVYTVPLLQKEINEIICDRYLKYVIVVYGRNSTIVFDGYPADITLLRKKPERRCKAKKCSRETLFDFSMQCSMTKEKFL